ncbi:MAG: hypothetical protein EWM51_04815 [Treponema sp.]|nr:MAG: hypothetical protein BWY39_01179 [Spirochaetes bacterium ADurb.Bin269]TAH54908.1 MAG: hypothetical protein EWM51_04815 [Treponema sp.]HQL32525.1 hypothetical protein [Treponemataceae bacterium]
MKRKTILHTIGSFLYIVFFSPFVMLFLISEAAGLLERFQPLMNRVRQRKNLRRTWSSLFRME